MAESENKNDQSYQAHQSVTDADLNEGKHVHCLITPVAGFVQDLMEVRLPDAEHPVIPEDEPNEEKQTQHRLREL